MKAVGIIGEFNPFHTGHAFLMEEARKKSGADYVITVMSGDFVQRGEPAVFDKYARTKSALEGGADLVFELPVRFCLSSAGDFAMGGILALASLGVVTDLYFGSECGDISPLMEAAQVLYQEKNSGHARYSEHLRAALKSGLSFPAARSQALSLVTSIDKKILEEPNNILGIEYCHALLTSGAPITPHTIKREGQAYNDAALTSGSPVSGGLPVSHSHPSATALRRQIYLSGAPHLCLDDCSDVIGYALLQNNNLEGIKDISPELAARMRKYSDDYRDATGFVQDCQTRTYTESRIRRALLQTVLELNDTSITMPYLRLLGMKKTVRSANSPYAQKNAGTLLKKVRHETLSEKTTLISRLAADIKEIDKQALTLLEKDLLASGWYRQMWQRKYKDRLPNEYQRTVIMY